MKKNFLITTGGSGGHVIPAIILFNHLKQKFNLFISTDLRGIKFFDKKYNVNIFDTPKLFSSFFLFPIRALIVLTLTVNSIYFIKKKKIDIIISTGGYAPIPLCLAGILLKKKLYLLEPNVVLGRSNKFFLKYSHKIFCYSKQIKNYPKIYLNKIFLISPLVRKEFYYNKRKKTKKFKLAIIGGSQGAKIFDEHFNHAIFKISKKIEMSVIHQTQNKNIKKLKNFYDKHKIENDVFSFKKRFIKILKNTDLCITRSGASTLAELFTLKIPFLAIPLPSSKDNHQYENAKYYKNKNCCWILKENQINRKYLTKFLEKIVMNKNNFNKKKSSIIKLSQNLRWSDQTRLLFKEFSEN